jgi:Tfp pilus assembly protein PilN
VPIPKSVRAVNLLPPDMHGASKQVAEIGAGPEATGGAGPFIVLGVLAAAVAGTAGYVLTENTIKQRQSDLASITAQSQQVAAAANKLKPYADFDALANSRVKTVKDLASSRFDWEQALRDLSRAVPADVTLKSLTGDVSTGGGGAGGQASQLRTAIDAPAISIQGCAPNQTEVARLVARLHDVDGVTRVTLDKSDEQKVTSNAASGNSIAKRNAEPCGPGARPSFDIVMFFQDAAQRVASQPSATSGSSATGTPAVTPTPTPSATPAGTSASTTSPEGANP